ncbi:MAG: FABP family protein [Acidimicrobiia bacterium]|jgi:hypothetical protein
MHPELAEISFLVGTWAGSGRGTYPTIHPFDYEEEVTFVAPPGKPFLAYTQRTRSPEGAPLHAEAGYLRPAGPGLVELVIAQPSGIVEVHHGTVTGRRLHLRSDLVGLTRTAKRVDSVERVVWVKGGVLRYELDMAAVGQPHQLHLDAELRRTG